MLQDKYIKHKDQAKDAAVFTLSQSWILFTLAKLVYNRIISLREVHTCKNN